MVTHSLLLLADKRFVCGHGANAHSLNTMVAEIERTNPVPSRGQSGTRKEAYARLINPVSGRRGMLRNSSCAAMDASTLHCQFSDDHLQFLVPNGRTGLAGRPIGDPLPFRSDVRCILKIRMLSVSAVSRCVSSFLRHEISIGFRSMAYAARSY
jgi:hypothetical protein